MKIRPNTYFVIAILLLALFIAIYSLTYDALKTKLIPLTVSIIVIILAAVELRNELVKEQKAEDETITETNKGEHEEKIGMGVYLPGFVWLGSFIFGIWIVGFLISIPLFACAYLKTHGCGWVSSIITALGLEAAVYVIFIVILHFKLFEGLVFQGNWF